MPNGTYERIKKIAILSLESHFGFNTVSTTVLLQSGRRGVHINIKARFGIGIGTAQDDWDLAKAAFLGFKL